MSAIAEPMHRAFWREEQDIHGSTVWRLYRSDIERWRGEVRVMPRGYVPFDSGTAHRAPSPVEDEWDSLDGAMWFLETTLLPKTFHASAKESRRVLLKSMSNPPADIPLPAWVLKEGGKGWPEVRLVNTDYDAKVVRNGMRAWFWSVSYPSYPLRCGIASSRTEAMAEVEQTLQLSAFLRRWAREQIYERIGVLMAASSERARCRRIERWRQCGGGNEVAGRSYRANAAGAPT